MSKGKTSHNPLELRVGEIDRFYAIAGGGNNFLASGDTLATATWTGPTGITLSADQINTQPLTLDGVEYAIGEVASVQCAGIRLHDLVEIICTFTTNSGRTGVESLWIRGA